MRSTGHLLNPIPSPPNGQTEWKWGMTINAVRGSLRQQGHYKGQACHRKGVTRVRGRRDNQQSCQSQAPFNICMCLSRLSIRPHLFHIEQDTSIIIFNSFAACLIVAKESDPSEGLGWTQREFYNPGQSRFCLTQAPIYRYYSYNHGLSLSVLHVETNSEMQNKRSSVMEQNSSCPHLGLVPEWEMLGGVGFVKEIYGILSSLGFK